MKVTRGLKNALSNYQSILTLGTFDGIHKGHKKIISKLISDSKKSNLRSIILTFFPHPRNIVSSQKIKSINTIDEKIEIFSELELDELIIQDFNKSFSNMSPEEFVKLLVNNLNLKKIIVGYNHRFGNNRSADINILKDFSLKYDFEVLEIKAFEVDKIKISSTKIRNAINEGNIDICNNYLGYNFNINGIVVKGKSIGKSIGFPTANINVIEEYKIIPKNGVYLARCFLDRNEYYGMMNIGFKPTFGSNKKTIEINIFGFDKDLYGKNIRIEFLKYIRDEIKFDNAEILQNQLNIDRENCVKLINSTYNN
tara:strand:+ start:131 stop:1063 length:933 start_codon:yes stop_codon:yes gene_type:complete